MVAREAHNLEVVGSSPASATKTGKADAKASAFLFWLNDVFRFAERDVPFGVMLPSVVMVAFGK